MYCDTNDFRSHVLDHGAAFRTSQQYSLICQHQENLLVIRQPWHLVCRCLCSQLCKDHHRDASVGVREVNLLNTGPDHSFLLCQLFFSSTALKSRIVMLILQIVQLNHVLWILHGLTFGHLHHSKKYFNSRCQNFNQQCPAYDLQGTQQQYCLSANLSIQYKLFGHKWKKLFVAHHPG